VERHRTVTVGDTKELADALDELVGAIDQARSLGLAVDVPYPLYLACKAVVHRYEPRHAGSEAVGRSLTDARSPARERPAVDDEVSAGPSISDMPLRRLLWQVLDPGEEFTVADVVARLAKLGAPWPPNAVSNALGYWASRQRLDRRRKGVYRWPLSAESSADNLHKDLGREIPAGARALARRKESAATGVQEDQRRAG
jgi:hypothetical protein